MKLKFGGTWEKKMTIDPAKYTIAIQQREVDGEVMFAARVKELPDVEVFESLAEEAYSAALEVIRSLASLADEENREFPAPSKISEDEEFSGRVTLRMPKGLHQKIAAVSEREGVSLNQYIVTVLATAAGEKSYFLRTTPQQEAVTKHIEWRATDSNFVTVVDLKRQEKKKGTENFNVDVRAYVPLQPQLIGQTVIEGSDPPYTGPNFTWNRSFGMGK
jgi:predicted HicB family RNase H-like nuclease